MNSNPDNLSIKSINQLLDYSFFIPAYQRGYRWTETQVKQLMDDLWQFAKNPPRQENMHEKPFYCLQPIVVKKHGEKEWEVIDGQQRLTTIYLILKNLKPLIESDKKNFSKISYETRIKTNESIGCWDFLRNIEENEKDKDLNIDFHHMYRAYKCIEKWFREIANNTDDPTPKLSFAPTFLKDTKVIWYEIEETNTNNSIDIFTRLNIGKIPLTNSELIKALFLKKGNFAEEKATLKQIQIATEWDMIEKKLQDDAFWFFIYPDVSFKKVEKEYDNRIEYVFDLMKELDENSEYYHTFNMFYADFLLNGNKKNGADKIWSGVKKYFMALEEWYEDYQLYHYVGYLIECGVSIKAIKEANKGKTKDAFKKYLKNGIKKQINVEFDEIDEIEYGDMRIRKILLLFNILTVLETQESDMRFPFHKYKLEAWDIEHVCSQTDIDITRSNQLDWVDDILEYFAGTTDVSIAEKYASNLIEYDNKEVKKIINNLIELKKSKKIQEDKSEIFEKSFKLVQNYFKEGNQADAINSISNLALLDSNTNRSYGNSFFPIKRKRIIENDKKGIFVPIATKNLFLKYYSKKFGQIMYWNNDDAGEYLHEIKSTLKDFFAGEDNK